MTLDECLHLAIPCLLETILLGGETVASYCQGRVRTLWILLEYRNSGRLIDEGILLIKKVIKLWKSLFQIWKRCALISNYLN